MRARLACAPLVALLVFGACTGGGDDAATTTNTTVGTTSSTTHPASATSTSTTVPTCPSVSVPGGATNASLASGDFDGDSASDELWAYLDGDTWHLQVALSAGGGDDIALAPPGPAAIVALGGFDVDEDGDDEAWARVGAGASTVVVGLFAFDECVLETVQRDGAPAHFAVGASVGSASGVECASVGSGDVDLTQFEGTSSDGVNYMTVSTLLHLDGSVLTVLATDVFNATATDDTFAFDCGAVPI